MKVNTNCYIVKSIPERFIKNQIGPWIMSLTIKWIHKLFILSIHLIFNIVKWTGPWIIITNLVILSMNRH